MGQVTATTEATVPATPADALAALSDYVLVRPAIQPEQYTDYAIEKGGQGTGTVVTWRLHATEKRVRHVVADVVVGEDSVTETDRNSSMVTVYTVAPAGSSCTKVTVTTTWNGAGGIGGFFERTFAPKGLNRIHGELLANLAARLGS